MWSYHLTRQEAAEELEISVRSIDRYIKAWKLRAKKKWKLVYIHDDDINHVSGKSAQKPIIITKIPSKSKKQSPIDNVEDSTNNEHYTNTHETSISKKGDYNKLVQSFEKVFTNLQNQIEKKDNTIQDLSLQLWQAKEQVKQTISVSEHNRSQMLLEESKVHIAQQMTILWEEKKVLEKKVKDEKFDKMILMIAVCILLMISAFIWFSNM